MTAYDLRISDWSSDVCSSDLDLSRATGRGGIVADMLDAGEPLQRRIVAGQARGGDVACIADVKREARAWRDVQLRPRRTDFRHQPDQPVDLGSGFRIKRTRIGHRPMGEDRKRTRLNSSH